MPATIVSPAGGGLVAGGLAYSALIALIPGMLLVAAAIGFLAGVGVMVFIVLGTKLAWPLYTLAGSLLMLIAVLYAGASYAALSDHPSFYVADLATLRSRAWFAGIGSAVAIFLAAA